jgi:hypothetical protein
MRVQLRMTLTLPQELRNEAMSFPFDLICLCRPMGYFTGSQKDKDVPLNVHEYSGNVTNALHFPSFETKKAMWFR